MRLQNLSRKLSRNLRSDFEVKYIITSFKNYEVIDSLGKEPRLKIKQKVGVNNKKEIYVCKGKPILYISTVLYWANMIFKSEEMFFFLAFFPNFGMLNSDRLIFFREIQSIAYSYHHKFIETITLITPNKIPNLALWVADINSTRLEAEWQK